VGLHLLHEIGHAVDAQRAFRVVALRVDFQLLPDSWPYISKTEIRAARRGEQVLHLLAELRKLALTPSTTTRVKPHLHLSVLDLERGTVAIISACLGTRVVLVEDEGNGDPRVLDLLRSVASMFFTMYDEASW